MTACQMLAQSLSATPSQPAIPQHHLLCRPHTTTKSLTYRPTLSIFSLYDNVLRRPVELASITDKMLRCRECPLCADFVAKVGGPLQVRNFRIQRARRLNQCCASECENSFCNNIGTKRTIAAPQQFVRDWTRADI